METDRQQTWDRTPAQAVQHKQTTNKRRGRQECVGKDTEVTSIINRYSH